MGHGWPYLAEHLWLATPGGGLAVAFYGESQVTAKVGDGTDITIRESTRYPFDDQVRFDVKISRPVAFPLYLRVPGWCDGARVEINGVPESVEARPLSYLRMERTWSDGDTVRLVLPTDVKYRTWTGNHGSVSVDRGPLTFSLKIGEQRVRSGGTDRWPAWEILPTTPWNYGLVLDPDEPASSFEVEQRPWPASNLPFTHEGTPILLKARGKRIPEWQIDAHGLVAPLQDSPVKSNQPAETILLIPMGAARLRISAFPVIGDAPDAHAWQAPEGPHP
jgi:hypothetical protein